MTPRAPRRYTASRGYPLRARVLALIERLEVEPGPVLRLLGRAPERWESMLRELESLGALEAALGLLPLALTRRGFYREEVLAVLDRLVRARPSVALLRLETLARDRESPWRRDAFTLSCEVTPERLDGVARRTTALGIASLHSSGFVRERAVRLLTGTGDPLALAFLLLRTNDWVAEVREPALRAVDDHLAARGPADLVPHLEIVDRLACVRRTDLRPLIARVESALRVPAASAALQRACASGSGRVRRRCLELALSARTFDVRPSLLAALDDADPVTRGLAARQTGLAFGADELRAIVGRLRTNSTPTVRRAALEVVAERLPAELPALAHELLLDPNASVREAARWHLRGAPTPTDVAACYRAALADPTTLAAAIAGLGETGVPADAGRIAPHLLDGRPRVRATAAAALGKLAPSRHRSDLVLLLADPSPRVAWTARDLLLRQPALDLELLADAALHGESASQRRCAVELLVRHEHWSAGLAWIRLARTGDEAVARRARMALQAWAVRFNRVFTPPTREQVAAYQRETLAPIWNDALGRCLRDLAGAMNERLR